MPLSAGFGGEKTAATQSLGITRRYIPEMVSIDVIEVLVGTLGLACSIYDPWVGDPYASVLVIFARTAGICTLFLVVAILLATLIPLSVVDVDPTTLAVVFFAAGASAPTLARGAWSLIDMGTMFMDLLRESYQDDNSARNARRPFGLSSFVAWMFAVFFTLMRHNVTWERLSPYAGSLLRAFRNNWEEFVHGKPIFDGNPVFIFSPASWATRAKALLNIVVLDVIAFGFLVLQSIAALGEVMLLSIGPIWVSLAVAAHAKGFEGYVRPSTDTPVQDVVLRLICCQTCHHGGSTGRNLDARANEKAISKVIPEVVKRSEAGRTSTRCSCCLCTCCGCSRA